MKYSRHNEIRKIINTYNIETQDELMYRLQDRGYNVTQATISRDIREMRLIKVAVGPNKFKYAVPAFDSQHYIEKYQYIIKETVIQVDTAQNLIILKTLPGMAQAAAAAVDGLGWKEIVGSIAGDDTIFIAMRSYEKAQEYAESFKDLKRFKYI